MTSATATLTALIASVFNFKTEKIKDEQGNTIGDGTKLPSATLGLPVPTVEALELWLSDKVAYAKELELVVVNMTEQVYRVARGQINDWRASNKDTPVTAEALNYTGLDWRAIANMPKSERASTVPSEEDQKAFFEAYLAIMPAALNKTTQRILNQIDCFKQGFKKQRTMPAALEMFQQALIVFTANAGEEVYAEHEDCVNYFTNRLTKLLASETTYSLADDL